MRRAVFLDRDGTLLVERDWIVSSSQIEFEARALEGARALHAAGWSLVVATNQSAVARGMLRVEDLEELHLELRRRMAAAGAPLLDIVYCPHHPTEGLGPWRTACACRKPGAGLLHAAARLHGLDLGACWLVGDALRDVQAARSAGTRSILVRTGKGAGEEARVRANDPRTLVEDDLAQAAAAILSR